MLHSFGNMLPWAVEASAKEHEVTNAKMHWFSTKENGKMYNLMVAYVTKTGDVRRLLEERYFHLARELIGWVF